jgi:hypothetical protein
LTERIAIPAGKLYSANLSLKELCLVEPLTVGSTLQNADASRIAILSRSSAAVAWGLGQSPRLRFMVLV